MDWVSLRLMSDLPSGPALTLATDHIPQLLVLSYLVASAAAYTALAMAERIAAARNRLGRKLWAAASCVCVGGSIWAMQVVAILAMQLPLSTQLNPSLLVLALMEALLTCWLVMHFIGKPELRWHDYAMGATVTGIGISLMQYTGLYALRSVALPYINPPALLFSIGLAITISLAAIVTGVYFRNRNVRVHLPLKVAASLAMGGAIISLHFAALGALSFVAPAGTVLQPQDSSQALLLAISIGMVAILLVGLGLVAAIALQKLEIKDDDLSRVNMLLGQLDRARDSLQQLANYDHLTNLFNRRAFSEHFAQRLQDANQRGQALGVLFLDIDHFKRINDTLGHDAGDELLKIFAKRIRTVLRSQDVIARFGGDEFCILSPLTERNEAVTVAQRIMQKLKEPITVGGRTAVMTTSIGIALHPDDGSDCEELLKHADLALYQAKAAGRNTIHVFSSQLTTRASMDLQLEEDLREALNADALTLFYQPLIDISSGKVVKLEALIRWQHPQHGLLSPDRFVGIAELNGFIGQLDAWSLRRASRDLRELHRHGYPHMRMAVNCSALNVGQDKLPHHLDIILREEGMPAGFMELEVTENTLMANIGKAAAVLSHIRELGMGLSIDDFGTG